jgi:hypothetical protein
MTCETCQAENPADARFCAGCGKPLTPTPTAPESPPITQAENTQLDVPALSDATAPQSVRVRFRAGPIALVLVAVALSGVLSCRRHANGSPSASDAVELRAVVNTEGDRVAASLFNKNISDLHIWKSQSAGTLRIAFTYDNYHPCACRFLLRLFDKNGNYLTHFTTDAHYELFHNKRAILPVSLDYDVNQRDLEYAVAAEFGTKVH